MQVLIVEDDHFYARLICERLQDQGVRTVIVRTAEEALESDITAYDGAVIDLMLPNDPEKSGITPEECRGGFHTGIAVARRLLKAKPTLRIVILTGDFGNPDARNWAHERSIPFISKHNGYGALIQALKRLQLLPGENTPLSFIVHGHDSQALFELKNYIQNTLKWQEPIILREQPSLGKTLIEKFEEFARRIDYVFVLLTPDDRIADSGSNEEKRRARPNVIFELGFFYGMLERRSGRIFLLHKGPIELPSDISGIVWIDVNGGVATAGEQIRKELAGLAQEPGGA
jgi:CheY-like chemotaxis protein